MNARYFSEKIISLKWLIILFVVFTTLFLGFQISKLTIDADVLRSLPDDDKHALLLKKIGQNFGGNRMGIVILETDDIYQLEVINKIQLLTDTVSNIDGISSVSSLTNIINIKGGDMGIEIGKLVDPYNLPQSEEDFNLLKSNIEANEMYKGSIVSADGTATLVVFTLEDEADVNRVAQLVIDKTQALNIDEKIYYIGSPMLITYIADLMKKDLSTLLPIAFILIGCILFASFRSWNGVILPLLSALIAIVWSLGAMGLMGYSMSMISNNIPIILLAIGSAYTIHVVNRVNQVRLQHLKNPISTALSYVLVPVILAAITTAIGFVSFVFGAYLEMIVDFGVFTALGTFFACLLSIFFVPALLAVFKKKELNSKPAQLREEMVQSQTFIGLKNVLFKRTKLILILWGVAILISISGIFSIKRSVDIQEYFKEGNPTRQAENIMVEKFGGTKPIFVHFKGNMQDPEVLSTMIKTSQYMEKSPDIYTSMSVAKLIAEINGAITGEKSVPEEMAMIEQLWFLLDGNEVMQRFVSEDLTEGIIISKFKSPDNQSKIAFSNYMDTFIQEHSSEKCQIEITGMPFVDITMDRSLINSQLGSISIAIVCVIIIVGIILRSMRSGFFAAIPIIVAIVILFGLMGLTGISLNIATVLVASVALGIGIDYSIHIISNFNKTYQKTKDLEESVQMSLSVSGRAILINVISVSTGFLVLVFSDMVPLQYFGILIATSMVSSSLGALTLLPALLIVNYKNRK